MYAELKMRSKKVVENDHRAGYAVLWKFRNLRNATTWAGLPSIRYKRSWLCLDHVIDTIVRCITWWSLICDLSTWGSSGC